MTANIVITDIFGTLQDHIIAEHNAREAIRNVTKEIEKHSREIVSVLQAIHHDNNAETISTACFKARQLLEEVNKGYQELSNLVPPGQYHKYNDHWRYVTQKLCFLVALVIFLEVGTLVSISTVAEILGVEWSPSQGFHLDLEDYLMGLLHLCAELARYAVNSVTSGDFSRPLQISKFVGELHAGFRLLNLKNDSLRKKFDALKYDVKKIEEVVYDLTIRGLITNGSLQPNSSSEEKVPVPKTEETVAVPRTEEMIPVSITEEVDPK